MGKYKYLLNNIALFTVSNFVSKILTFLMVPFYTNFLSVTEYGVIDLMQATLLLAVPALTVNIGEGALRFALEKTESRGDILRIGLKVLAAGMALVALLCTAASFFFRDGQMKRYLLFFVFLYASNCLYEFLILFFQGCEKVRVVVAGSVLGTFLFVTGNLVCILGFRMGLYGYLLSRILSFLGAAALMFFMSGAKEYVKTWRRDRELLRQMLRYGGPLIVHSTGSWINNASDRYIVRYLCGLSASGLYGVAYQIPNILNVLQRIFAQAWQMSATKSYAEKDGPEFFSSMYKAYNTVMVLGCSFLIVTIKILARFLFAKDFYGAFQIVPPLLLSMVFGALTGFLGSICLAYKDSKSMGKASGIGAVLNVALNFVLIHFIGVLGAAVATGISYYVMYFIAFLVVRGYVRLDLDLKRDYLTYLLLVIQAVVAIKDMPWGFFVNLALLAVIAALYAKDIAAVAGRLKLSRAEGGGRGGSARGAGQADGGKIGSEDGGAAGEVGGKRENGHE